MSWHNALILADSVHARYLRSNHRLENAHNYILCERGCWLPIEQSGHDPSCYCVRPQQSYKLPFSVLHPASCESSGHQARAHFTRDMWAAQSPNGFPWLWVIGIIGKISMSQHPTPVCQGGMSVISQVPASAYNIEYCWGMTMNSWAHKWVGVHLQIRSSGEYQSTKLTWLGSSPAYCVTLGTPVLSAWWH